MEMQCSNWPLFNSYTLMKVPKDWTGLYTIHIRKGNVYIDMQLYNDIIEWIKVNIKRTDHNVWYTGFSTNVYFVFRKPKDKTLFILRWGSKCV
jgi:hypothetical protein